MFKKIKGWLYKFMYGRNGADDLSRALLLLSIIVLLPSSFIKNNIRIVFLVLFWIIVIYSYYRMFSKKLYDRKKENDWYVGKINYIKLRFSQRKNYRFFDCPKCKTHLRVPKGVGKITITCNKCGYQFDKKA